MFLKGDSGVCNYLINNCKRKLKRNTILIEIRLNMFLKDRFFHNFRENCFTEIHMKNYFMTFNFLFLFFFPSEYNSR